MVVAHYEQKGHRFEIIIEPDAIDELRQGKEVNMLRRMASFEIFKDARKGDRASEVVMKEIFGTDDVDTVARAITIKGDVHLTTEQKRKMQEDKKKQIVAVIARNAMNPQTGAPHPPARIEAAMDEAGVHVDPFKPADQQVKEVLDALRPLIPIRFDKVRIAVKFAAEDYARCYGDIKEFGKVMNEEWQRDGSWIGVVEIPAGMQTDFLSRLNERTKGNVETKLLRQH
ncbi:MAG: ribosome assembly factor SBDS [Euryarchaeota archaeon]|nr:ribosome assembly factor SBDS [Euryarchaeota archaeon]